MAKGIQAVRGEPYAHDHLSSGSYSSSTVVTEMAVGAEWLKAFKQYIVNLCS